MLLRAPTPLSASNSCRRERLVPAGRLQSSYVLPVVHDEDTWQGVTSRLAGALAEFIREPPRVSGGPNVTLLFDGVPVVSVSSEVSGRVSVHAPQTVTTNHHVGLFLGATYPRARTLTRRLNADTLTIMPINSDHGLGPDALATVLVDHMALQRPVELWSVSLAGMCLDNAIALFLIPLLRRGGGVVVTMRAPHGSFTYHARGGFFDLCEHFPDSRLVDGDFEHDNGDH